MIPERRPLKRNERRANTRYPMGWPVMYRNGSEWKRGRCIDLSAGGILAGLPKGVAAGAVLELMMDWPGLYHNEPAMQLHLKALVVRVDSRGAGMRILNHEFRTVRTGAPARRVTATCDTPPLCEDYMPSEIPVRTPAISPDHPDREIMLRT